MPLIQADPSPIFMPAWRDILSITNANPAVVTTTFPHGYITGCIARLYIPPGFGMQQANLLYAPIIVLSPTTFSIAINTSGFDAYVLAAPPGPPPPTPTQLYGQVVPIGEQTDTFLSTFRNILQPEF
jgi:hypothetical protein